MALQPAWPSEARGEEALSAAARSGPTPPVLCAACPDAETEGSARWDWQWTGAHPAGSVWLSPLFPLSPGPPCSPRPRRPPHLRGLPGLAQRNAIF